jgi:L-asparaginase II
MSRITAPRRLAALAATLAVGASFAAAAPAVHAEPNTGGGTPTGCQLKGKDKNGASFTDTYAEGTEITVTSPAGTTMKFKCVNGSWQQQMRVRNPRLANVVVSNVQMARMIG